MVLLLPSLMKVTGKVMTGGLMRGKGSDEGRMFNVIIWERVGDCASL